jgi:hypothetical protein
MPLDEACPADEAREHARLPYEKAAALGPNSDGSRADTVTTRRFMTSNKHDRQKVMTRVRQNA